MVDMLLAAVKVMERVWVFEGPSTGLDGLYMRHGAHFWYDREDVIPYAPSFDSELRF